MGYDTVIKLGTVILGGSGQNTVTGLSKGEVEATAKSIINGVVILTVVPGKGLETRIEIRGVLQGANRDSDRSTLNTYHQGNVRRYDDGITSGDFVMETGSLRFDDINTESRTRYLYSMVLREWP